MGRLARGLGVGVGAGVEAESAPSSSLPRYTCPDVISSVTTWPCMKCQSAEAQRLISRCSRGKRTWASFSNLIGIPIVLVIFHTTLFPPERKLVELD